MINIISRSILEKRMRGPKKVALNLMAGLDQINYPYVVNRALDATSQLWIHDDVRALSHLKSLPAEVKILIGPNLFVNPEDIPANINLNKTLYLQPSESVKKIWQARGFNQTEIAIWPVGVDTDKFRPENLEKEHVLIYFKNRKEEELSKILSMVGKENFKLFRYGYYQEADFQKELQKSKYIIWLGIPESQGLALLEALSMNVPVLIIDHDKTEYGIKLSAAPYFSAECGRKIENLDDFPAALSLMKSGWQNFQPRNFVLENLSLERQAHQFLNFYQDYFHYSIDEGKHQKLNSHNLWRNGHSWFRIYIQLKEMLK